MRFALALLLVACTSSPQPGPIDHGGARVLADLADFAPFVEHRGVGGLLVRDSGWFTVARPASAPAAAWSPAGTSLRIVMSSDGVARLSTAHASLEIVPDVTVPLDAHEGALAGSNGSIGVALVAEQGRIEEIRLARTLAAARVSRWTLRSPNALRLQDGRIEVVSAYGVSIASEPMFAIDARGLRRSLDVTLEGDVLTARLDTAGMTLPIAIDPAWTGTEAPAAARMKHTATLLKDGRILVVGGFTSLDASAPATATAEVYDPAKDKNVWKPAGTMSVARFGHTATLLADGKVLVTGGASSLTAVATTAAEIYDPATNTWKDAGAMGSPRVGHFAIPTAAGVLLAGGLKSADPGTPMDAAPHYMLFEGEGKPMRLISVGSTDPPLPAFPVVIALDKKALILGGRPATAVGSARDVILFEEPQRFTKKGSLRRDRLSAKDYTALAGAAFADGNHVLITGGGDDSAEKIAVPSASSEHAGDLLDLWAGQTLSRLPSGDFLAVGGYVPGSATSLLPPSKMFPSPFLYRVKTSEWVAASAPSARRWAHTATVLSDGRVVVIGGRNKDEVIRGGDIYQPQALGDKCAHDGDCTSGFCVDSVCCDRACIDQCEACNAGKCGPITGAPRGLRPLCENPGGDVCKAKVCDGVTTNTCVLPKDNKCSDASCTPPNFTAEGACNGMGACIKPPAKDCGAFGCTEDGCRTTCVVSGECAPGAICVDGVCISSASGTCNAELSASLDKGREPIFCSPYKCVRDTGKCADSCTTSNQCAGGYICGGNNRCEPPGVGDEGGGCAMGHPGGSGAAVALLLALAAITSRARRP